MTLGIAGVGLIGGSIALCARAAGYTTIGFDRDEAAVDAALAAGALDDRAADLAGLARRCEAVVLALPVDVTIEALAGTPELAVPALLFDVASVKAPVAVAGAHLANFVPSHPLAGRETGGFAAADPALFARRPWVLDPAAPAAPRARLAELVETLGAHVVELTSAEHDHLVAVTSHLPQALSVALAAQLAAAGAADARAYEVCGPGIASMLRLARSPASLWEPIVRANAGPLARELRGVAAKLETAAAGLEVGEVAGLMSYFADAAPALTALSRPDEVS